MTCTLLVAIAVLAPLGATDEFSMISQATHSVSAVASSVSVSAVEVQVWVVV
jgi:hypothetical protein